MFISHSVLIFSCLNLSNIRTLYNYHINPLVWLCYSYWGMIKWQNFILINSITPGSNISDQETTFHPQETHRWDMPWTANMPHDQGARKCADSDVKHQYEWHTLTFHPPHTSTYRSNQKTILDEYIQWGQRNSLGETSCSHFLTKGVFTQYG